MKWFIGLCLAGALGLIYASYAVSQELIIVETDKDLLEQLWEDDPARAVEVTGISESCFDRCSHCKNGDCPNPNCHCPFTECVENCSKSGHNHPICCVGCCYEPDPDIQERDAEAQALADRMGVPVTWEPPSKEVAEAVAEYLGLDKSCGDRCSGCTNGGCSDGRACPFFSCTINCAAGHHPVCCWGCGDSAGCRP